MAIRNKTEEEIKKLAFDTAKGKVFTSMMALSNSLFSDDGDLTVLKRIFWPLWFLTDEQIEDIKAYNPVIFYEYFDEASPLLVDGYPVFETIRMLNGPEYRLFQRWVKAYEGAVNNMNRVLDKMELNTECN